MSPWTFVLIILAAGAGVAAIPVLVGFCSRLVDPDADWVAPVLLGAGLLIAFVVVISPVVGLLALVGLRTAAGVLAAAEAVALAAGVMLLVLVRLRRL